jgi:hypothetical protein
LPRLQQPFDHSLSGRDVRVEAEQTGTSFLELAERCLPSGHRPDDQARKVRLVPDGCDDRMRGFAVGGPRLARSSIPMRKTAKHRIGHLDFSR